VSKLPKSKARSVGVSNFTYKTLKALVDQTGLVPAVNQIERHPILPSKELIAYAKEKNIHITAYSAFGNNFFDIPLLITRPEVKAIAEKKGATPAQVILAWSQVGGHSVIPKSVTPARIAENFKEIDLSDDDIAAIQKFSDEHQGRRRYNVPYTASKYLLLNNGCKKKVLTATSDKPRWSIDIFGEPEEQEAPNKIII
jgi:L-glyceraldehyde reductase